MLNYVQEGKTLTLTPSADVAAGEGYLFGAGLFGVALAATASGAAGEFLVEGVVNIAKTSALAISVGDRVFWVPGSKVVDKTATAQVNVGVAILAAANPSGTVRIKLGAVTASGA
jgi:predicted RecA/RadA family phage recombinase